MYIVGYHREYLIKLEENAEWIWGLKLTVITDAI